MQSAKPKESNNNSNYTETTKEVQIYIFGMDTFKNALLAKYIQDQTGMRCHNKYFENLNLVITSPKKQNTVILFDCMDLNTNDLWFKLKKFNLLDSEKTFPILNQVEYSWKIETQAINIGIRGILYTHQELELYPKAINAVLEGELWFPRKALEKHLLTDQPHSRIRPPNNSITKLTLREREILTLLASGISNQNIADQLCISTHTVKTHIYNIYKKLNVGNRLQAALWVSKIS